jgi:hypothetical protein
MYSSAFVLLKIMRVDNYFWAPSSSSDRNYFGFIVAVVGIWYAQSKKKKFPEAMYACVLLCTWQLIKVTLRV